MQKTTEPSTDVDENGIPIPIKRMAWEMIPENSKFRSILGICQRPPDKPSSPPSSLPLPVISSALPHPTESFVAAKTEAVEIAAGEPPIMSRKAYDAKNAFKARLTSKVVGMEEAQKTSESSVAETSEMIVEELDPQLLLQRAGLTTDGGGGAPLRLPDAISEVSSIVEKEK